MTSLDWSNAPHWAQWWAVAEDGQAFWFSQKPEISYCRPDAPEGFWALSGYPFVARSGQKAPAGVHWTQTLTQRPVVTP